MSLKKTARYGYLFFIHMRITLCVSHAAAVDAVRARVCVYLCTDGDILLFLAAALLFPVLAYNIDSAEANLRLWPEEA